MIASWREVLKLSEDVAEAIVQDWQPARIGFAPPFKRVFEGASPSPAPVFSALIWPPLGKGDVFLFTIGDHDLSAVIGINPLGSERGRVCVRAICATSSAS